MTTIVNAMLITIGAVLGLLVSSVCLAGIALGVSWVMGRSAQE